MANPHIFFRAPPFPKVTTIRNRTASGHPGDTAAGYFSKAMAAFQGPAVSNTAISARGEGSGNAEGWGKRDLRRSPGQTLPGQAAMEGQTQRLMTMSTLGGWGRRKQWDAGESRKRIGGEGSRRQKYKMWGIINKEKLA